MKSDIDAIGEENLISIGDRLTGQSGAAYVVEERIGVGGTSQVHRVRDAAGQAYAAKLLSGHRFAITEQLGIRFTREVSLLSKIAHPNVIAFIDTGHLNGQPFLIMELAEMSLYEYLLRDGKLAQNQALSILLGALNGLVAIHDAGMVHRDLAPRNILLTVDGRVVIGDFGTVHNLTDATITGDVALGSLIYISREQFENPHEVKSSDDVFQLGQVAYELLSGVKPIGNAPVLETYASSLDRLVGKMRAPSRHERFPTAREAKDRLLGIVDATKLSGVRYGGELADRVAALHTARQICQLESADYPGLPATADLLRRLVKQLGALDFDLSALFRLSRDKWDEPANGEWVPSTAGLNRLFVGGSLMWETYIAHTDGRELRDECAVTNSTTGKSIVVVSSLHALWPEIRNGLEPLLQLSDTELRRQFAPFSRRGWLYGGRCTDCGDLLHLQISRKSGTLHRESVCSSEPSKFSRRCALCGDALREAELPSLGMMLTCGCKELTSQPRISAQDLRSVEEKDVPSLFFRYRTGRPKVQDWDTRAYWDVTFGAHDG